MTTTSQILAEVYTERECQDRLWGGTPGVDRFNQDTYPAVLGEEVGEAHKAWLEKDIPSLREELVQVAAVSVAWIEEIDNGGGQTR